MSNGPNSRGQALVDYVVIMGVVLVLALIVLGLLGFLPDLAFGYKNRQSIVFWRDQARPITIIEAHYRMSNSHLFLSMQTQTDEPLNLTGLYADGKQVAIYSYVPFYGGDSLVCNATSCLSAPCTCSLPLAPRADVPLRTEAFGNGLGCRTAGTQIPMPVQLRYARANDGSRSFTQNGSVELIVDCQQ